MGDSDNKLYDLIKFYNSELEPYIYKYKCMFGININFTIDPDQVCHLIMGSVNNNIPNAKSYKGKKGYENIVNKKITKVPIKIQKEFNSKSKGFLCLPQLLKNPTAIFFNHKIVQKGNIKGLGTTSIDADFLLYKEFQNIKVHLFLKWSNSKNKLVPYSLITNTKVNYIINQKSIKILNKHIDKKPELS